MPDDDQHGSADGYDGCLFAAAPSDASVALAEEGVGPAGGDGGLTEDFGQVPVAVPGGAVALALARGLLGGGGELRPGAQVSRGGEPAHVHPDLGEDHGSGGGSDARDLIQARHGISERGDHFLDGGLQLGDVGAERVDPGQHLGQQQPVMIGEIPRERLLQLCFLRAHPAPGHRRENLRVTLAANQCLHHLATGHPENVAGHHGQFDLGVLQQLFHPLFFRGAGLHQISAIPGHVPQPADLRRRHETGPQHLPFSDFTQPYRIKLVRLRTAR